MEAVVSTPPEFVFEFRATPEDHLRAIRASVGVVVPWWAGLPSVLVTVVVVGALARATSGAWLGGVTAAVFAIAILHYASKLESRVRLEHAIERDPHSAERQRVELSATGVRFMCDHAESMLQWSGVRAVRESADHYLFVCGPLGACPVPKSAIAREDVERFRAFLREHSPDGGAALLSRRVPPSRDA
jgi:hypothetical protein